MVSHPKVFSDIRSTDGNMLIMTSTDGFCSTIIFEPGELGEIHPGPAPTTISSTLSHSRPSPSTTSNPSFPTPSSGGRASSPTRSNSSSSVATLSNFASTTPKISQVPSSATLSAPSPTSTFVQPTTILTSSSYPATNRNPSVSSAGSVPPLGTPPETPTSTSGIPQKREGDISDPSTETASEEEPKSKKRRVAPTLISPAESQK